MKPIFQNTPYNCVEACVASLFGDKDIIGTFPKLLENKLWIARYRKHIRETYGLAIIACDVNTLNDIQGYVIAGGLTASTVLHGYGHCVIYKNGKMVHDPWEGSGGLTEIQEYIFLKIRL